MNQLLRLVLFSKLISFILYFVYIDDLFLARVTFAFGLTVLTMVYAVGHISVGHFNPAVSLGLWSSGRFSSRDLLPYIFVQCVRAITAAGTLYLIALGKTGFVIENTKAGVFATNGFRAFSPDGYTMQSAFITEFVLTLFFLLIIMGATDNFANGKFAGGAIGLRLTLIHLISYTNYQYFC